MSCRVVAKPASEEPGPDKAKAAETAKAQEQTGDKVEIKWKLEKDKPLYESMTTSTSQDMKVMGMDVKQKQDQTFYFSWQLKDEDKDKNCFWNPEAEETDAVNSDSDGDGLPDGKEDRNKDGGYDPATETNALDEDTDEGGESK